MATAEAKTEATAESKTESKEAEGNPEPLKYKVWVLKVSIHCEGCKKKVKKILNNIDGVYQTDVDLRQHKVTVTGNVEAETLIRKMEKAGKHAALWPEKSDRKEKRQGKSKNKEKQTDPEDSSKEESNHGGDKEKETVKIDKPSEMGKNSGQVKESKPEVKVNVNLPAGNHSQPTVAEKKVVGEGDGGAKKSGGGSGGKKKKKKGQKGNNGNVVINVGEGQHSGDAPAGTGSPQESFRQVPVPANHSPPRQHVHQQLPPLYYAPPVYAVSYNTAYPSTSYATSHYASPPPYSCVNMHPGPGSEAQPSDPESYSVQPSDSFEMFSDENPNACSVM